MMLRLLFCLSLTTLCVHGGWKDLYKFPWTSVPLPITTALACPNTTTCFVTGGTHSSLPEVHYTKDWKTFTLANSTSEGFLLVDIAFDKSAKAGLAGGVGALKLPGIVYSTDGGTQWHGSDDITAIEANRVEPLNDGAYNFAFIGSTNVLFNDNGVGVTSNSGKTFHADKFPSAQAPAGCFPEGGQFFGQTWYVMCSSSPEQESSEADQTEDAMEIVRLKHPQYSLAYNRKHKESKLVREDLKYITGNYTGAILKSTDGGKTYTTQFKEAGKYSIIDICCSSDTHCVAIAIGISGEPGYNATQPGSTVLLMTDGKTWNQVQHYALPIFFQRCTYVDDGTTSGAFWIAAASPTSTLKTYVFFMKSTDGGKTYANTGGEVHDLLAILDFAFVEGSKGKRAYALAGTIDDQITPLEYTED